MNVSMTNRDISHVTIKPSTRKDKKFMAQFKDASGRRIKTTHFGGAGCMDFIKYSKLDPTHAKQKRLQYIKRHRVRESWRDPTAAGTLSRYILWEKPTLNASLKKYRMMFRLD